MSTALSWGRLEVHHTGEPTAHCQAGIDSIAVSARTQGSLRLLVAADVERYGLMVSHTFRRAVNAGRSLPLIAEELDEAISRVSMPSLCATLVDISPSGFTVLHRGGPAPIVVRGDGALTRVVATVPGPPLGPHQSVTSDSRGEFVPASAADVLVVTTPGSVERATHAIADAESATLKGLWESLLALGTADLGNAIALASVSS
ncbi:MAG: SpoIIE family protein phosphatase [Candidatus Nanopelagicales bacterium]